MTTNWYSYTVFYKGIGYTSSTQVTARTAEEATYKVQKNFTGCQRVTSVSRN